MKATRRMRPTARSLTSAFLGALLLLGASLPCTDALRRFTLVRDHDTPMASFRPALTEAPQRITKPHWGRPVNSGPRPCLFSVGFPLSGLQVRTYTSDLNIRAQHTRDSRVAGAVARPGSHRTVRTLVVYGSSGRRVMTPAAGRFVDLESFP